MIAQTGQGAPSHIPGTTRCSPACFSLDLAKHLNAGLNPLQSLAEISNFAESRSEQAEVLAVTRKVNFPSYVRERCSYIAGVGSSYQEVIVPLESKHPHVASHQHTCDLCTRSQQAHTFMGCFSSFQTTPG